jgi:hypothetical protein
MALNNQQRADLATLLAEHIGRDNLQSLAVYLQLPNTKVDVRESELAIAIRLVAAVDDGGLLNRAMSWLQQGLVDPYFDVQLRDVLAGRRIDDASKQALRNTLEPFLGVKGFTELLPRVGRAVCAIGIKSSRQLVGSGFLIAPDMVMTNFHVMRTCLKEEATAEPNEKRWVAATSGSEIYCFFDYHAPPVPDVPPSPWALERTVCVNAIDEGWLIYARCGVTPEGTIGIPEKDCREYDCVVFKLAEPIGKAAVPNAVNRRRGWLTLPEQVNVLAPQGQKLLVFQHPQQNFQSLDVGDYKKLHPSQTRVWYAVSTAHGSSGGAAVDSKGELFALHNALVTEKDDEGLNQGIRIDLIGKDLRASVPAINLTGANTDDDRYPWSMSDDPAKPEPIIGRRRFMELVGRVAASKTERALVVVGPRDTGVRYSAKILRRVLGPQVRAVEFTASDLQTLRPRDFLKALLFKLGVVPPVDTAPPPHETENVSTWLRLDLPKWLVGRLTEHPSAPFDSKTTASPSWVVINAVMPTPASTSWAAHLKDFLGVLAGVKDAGQEYIDVPQLRWLFLGNAADDLPVRASDLQDEDLSQYVGYEQDFVSCVQRAWLTLDKYEIPTEEALQELASTVKIAYAQIPLRKALSDSVLRTLQRKRLKNVNG